MARWLKSLGFGSNNTTKSKQQSVPTRQDFIRKVQDGGGVPVHPAAKQKEDEHAVPIILAQKQSTSAHSHESISAQPNVSSHSLRTTNDANVQSFNASNQKSLTRHSSNASANQRGSNNAITHGRDLTSAHIQSSGLRPKISPPVQRQRATSGNSTISAASSVSGGGVSVNRTTVAGIPARDLNVPLPVAPVPAPRERQKPGQSNELPGQNHSPFTPSQPTDPRVSGQLGNITNAYGHKNKLPPPAIPVNRLPIHIAPPVGKSKMEVAILSEYSDPADIKRIINDNKIYSEEDYTEPFDLHNPTHSNYGKAIGAPSSSSDPAGPDIRPAEEYDSPWEYTSKLARADGDLPLTVVNGESRVKPGLTPSGAEGESGEGDRDSAGPSQSPNTGDQRPMDEYDTPWEWMQKKKTAAAAAALGDVGGDGKRKSANLKLSIPAAHPEYIDPTVVIEKQKWYHGAISRSDAEELLKSCKEGSFLVRQSESNRQDYSLSLKSVHGFMHMKIVHEASAKPVDEGGGVVTAGGGGAGAAVAGGGGAVVAGGGGDVARSGAGYVLGQYSSPFPTIPEMIYFYTQHKLPIRGAEHMSLMHPVAEQLL